MERDRQKNPTDPPRLFNSSWALLHYLQVIGPLPAPRSVYPWALLRGPELNVQYASARSSLAEKTKP